MDNKAGSDEKKEKPVKFISQSSLAIDSHSLIGKSISGKPLLEIVIDKEEATDFDQIDLDNLHDPPISKFPLKVCFDHLMKHFDGNVFETFQIRTLLDHARKTKKFFSFRNL